MHELKKIVDRIQEDYTNDSGLLKLAKQIETSSNGTVKVIGLKHDTEDGFKIPYVALKIDSKVFKGQDTLRYIFQDHDEEYMYYLQKAHLAADDDEAELIGKALAGDAHALNVTQRMYRNLIM